MSAALPQLDRQVRDLADRISVLSGGVRTFILTGGATGGKTAALLRLERALRDRGQTPVVVDPPLHSWDAGGIAMAKMVQSIPGTDPFFYRDPKRPWADKLASLDSEVRRVGDSVIFLLDEPYRWHRTWGEDSHFGTRAGDMVRLLERTATRWVSTSTPDEAQAHQPAELIVIKTGDRLEQWLSREDIWGPELLGAAQFLLDRHLGDLRGYKLLEIRLLVGLHAIGYDARAALGARMRLQRLVQEFARHLRGDPHLREVAGTWARLALLRQRFSPELLRIVGEPAQALPRSLVQRVLLFEQVTGELVLHETLRREPEQGQWLTAVDKQKFHHVFACYYRDLFAAQAAAAASGSSGTALDIEMEAFHHACEGYPNDIDSFQPFFTEQLDHLGFVLSKLRDNYPAAVDVFKRAVVWDDTDSYAHHYLAYNLDVQGVRPEEVEQHYLKAIDLAVC